MTSLYGMKNTSTQPRKHNSSAELEREWVARPQVKASHYQRCYMFYDRWCQYYWQISQTLAANPKNALVVGIGDGIVPMVLKDYGIEVTTLDLASDLDPDILSPIDDVPLPDNSFDVVVCCEVLEHMPYEISQVAMRELHRITRNICLVSVPHSTLSFAVLIRLPIIHLHELRARLSINFWKAPTVGGEHYWELGYRGYSARKFKKDLVEAGFHVLSTKRTPTEYSCATFVLQKQ